MQSGMVGGRHPGMNSAVDLILGHTIARAGNAHAILMDQVKSGISGARRIRERTVAIETGNAVRVREVRFPICRRRLPDTVSVRISTSGKGSCPEAPATRTDVIVPSSRFTYMDDALMDLREPTAVFVAAVRADWRHMQSQVPILMLRIRSNVVVRSHGMPWNRYVRRREMPR